MGQREINKKLKEMDIKFGDNNEAIGKNLIEDYLDMPLRNYKDKYATFDFFNTDLKVIVELKSRRNSSQKYKTQLIGKNKFDKAKVKISEGYKVYFFWLLQDGLYVYEVNKNQNFETTYLGNYARNDKSKELILIPNLVLKKTIPKEERTTEDKNKVEPYILKWD
tara:strand:- start:463 stop:957 length:495 start_codon:yes stop_codon:yes gene_type:complete